MAKSKKTRKPRAKKTKTPKAPKPPKPPRIPICERSGEPRVLKLMCPYNWKKIAEQKRQERLTALKKQMAAKILTRAVRSVGKNKIDSNLAKFEEIRSFWKKTGLTPAQYAAKAQNAAKTAKKALLDLAKGKTTKSRLRK